MKITSYNRSAGRRGKEKVHHQDDALGVGYQRDGITGARVPGMIVTLYFDGRAYCLEMGEGEAESFVQRVANFDFGHKKS